MVPWILLLFVPFGTATIYQKCQSDSDCNGSTNQHCVQTNQHQPKTCMCLAGYRMFNRRCIRPSRMGGPCSEAIECLLSGVGDLDCIGSQGAPTVCACRTSTRFDGDRCVIDESYDPGPKKKHGRLKNLSSSITDGGGSDPGPTVQGGRLVGFIGMGVLSCVLVGICICFCLMGQSNYEYDQRQMEQRRKRVVQVVTEGDLEMNGPPPGCDDDGFDNPCYRGEEDAQSHFTATTEICDTNQKEFIEKQNEREDEEAKVVDRKKAEGAKKKVRNRNKSGGSKKSRDSREFKDEEKNLPPQDIAETSEDTKDDSPDTVRAPVGSPPPKGTEVPLKVPSNASTEDPKLLGPGHLHNVQMLFAHAQQVSTTESMDEADIEVAIYNRNAANAEAGHMIERVDTLSASSIPTTSPEVSEAEQDRRNKAKQEYIDAIAKQENKE